VQQKYEHLYAKTEADTIEKLRRLVGLVPWAKVKLHIDVDCGTNVTYKCINHVRMANSVSRELGTDYFVLDDALDILKLLYQISTLSYFMYHHI
jgi:hypothetical protein